MNNIAEAAERQEKAAAVDTVALPIGPGALGSPAPVAGGDIWQMSAEAFAGLTRRAINGELVNMEGDL